MSQFAELSTTITDYVRRVKAFEPGQYAGAYAAVPFTHEQWLAYVGHMWDGWGDLAISVGDEEIQILVCPFEHNGHKFVLRLLAMGESVDQLWTEEYYRESFPEEAAKVFGAINDNSNSVGG